MSTPHLLRPYLRAARCLNAPSLAFSTSAPPPGGFTRSNRDRSKRRGVSALRQSPGKAVLSAEKHKLPVPVKKEDHKKVEVSPDHGLWGFFVDKKALPTPTENDEHGRAWTVEELRKKSWEDLHKLWWVCVKELNIIETQRLEFERLEPGDGDHEARRRFIQVKNTQRGIKYTLTERYYAWEDARELAKEDKEIDLSGNGPAYAPQNLEEGTLDVLEPASQKPTSL